MEAKTVFSGPNWCLPFEIGLYTANCHVIFAAIAATVSDSKGRLKTHSCVYIDDVIVWQLSKSHLLLMQVEESDVDHLIIEQVPYSILL